MTLEKALVHQMIMLGAFTVISTLAVAQTPSPALLVLDRGNPAIDGGDKASLAIVDPLTNKIVGRVPVGESPHLMAVSADGKLAFVVNYGWRNPGHTISVIDVAAQRELRRVDLGPLRRPSGIVVAGGKVYFTAEANNAIGRYDPASNKIDWVIGTGQNHTHMIVLTKDLKTIFTSNVDSNSVTAIEPVPPHHRVDPPDWKNTVIPVGKGPEGIDISPDDKEVWVAARDDGSISIIDVATKKVTQTLNIQTKESVRLNFTPDGKMVLVTDGKAGDVVILDAVARKVIKRINLGKHPINILVVPDGSHAYVGVSRDNDLAIIDLKTLELTGRIPIGAPSDIRFAEKEGNPNGPSGMAWVETR